MNGFTIRPFTEADIQQAADLHRRGFQLPEHPGQREAYRNYFADTFLNSDWTDADCPSLVAADDDGRIAGFLGVVTRTLSLGGAPVRAALSSQFVVDPDARTRLVGVALLKRFLSGPQDLSFTDEAVERSAVLWERLGGVRSPIHSLHWILPLRPAALLLWRMRRQGEAIRPRLAQPFASAGDGLINLLTRRGRRPNQAGLRPQPQSPERLAEHLRALRNEWPLIPDYRPEHLERLIDIARSRVAFGQFQSVSLHKPNGSVAGWYMYYADPGGLSEVIQLASRAGMEADVFSHLTRQALADGSAGLIGRMDPRFQRAIARNISAVSPRECFMLVHSRNPTLVRLITSGFAFLSRLEGEWCLRFQCAQAGSQAL
jgi:hypothetical protein